MSQLDKLLGDMRANPRAVRFADLKRILESRGVNGEAKGSHCVAFRGGVVYTLMKPAARSKEIRVSTSAKQTASQVYVEYPVEITRDEFGFFARVPDLPGCASNGDTLDDAYASIQEARDLWIETVTASGGTVPRPRGADDYSGKFVVRVGASVHRDLVRIAAMEGVSLNALVSSVLARETGRRSGILGG